MMLYTYTVMLVIGIASIISRLYINMAWGDDLDVGEYIIIECYIFGW